MSALYKPPHVLTERIVDLVERIGEELGRHVLGKHEKEDFRVI